MTLKILSRSNRIDQDVTDVRVKTDDWEGTLAISGEEEIQAGSLEAAVEHKVMVAKIIGDHTIPENSGQALRVAVMEMRQLAPPNYQELVTWALTEKHEMTVDQQVGACMARSHGKADPRVLRGLLQKMKELDEE